MMLGVGIVLVYTLAGGMFSVAFTDLFQMLVIGAGMIYIAIIVSGIAGRRRRGDRSRRGRGKFDFWPKPEARDVILFVSAWATMGLGSIPQQDVFQRVSAAKNEKTPPWVRCSAGHLLLLRLRAMFLAYSAIMIDPKMSPI